MNILRSLLLGVLAAFAALVIESAVSLFPAFTYPDVQDGLDKYAIIFIGVFALLEEIIKYLLIRKNISYIAKDKIVFHSIFIGFGFSLAELGFRLVDMGRARDIFSLPYLFLMMIHILTAIIIGYAFYRKKENQSKLPQIALLAAFIVHFGYNLAVLYLF